AVQTVYRGGSDGSNHGDGFLARIDTIRIRAEETSSQIQYTGAWNVNTSQFANHSGKRSVTSTDAGGRATFTFTGTGARWIGFMDQWSGIAKVYFDGIIRQEVDTYSLTEQSQVILYSVEFLEPGTHTLAVEVAGQRNPASYQNWVWV